MHFGAPYELSLANFEVNCASCTLDWENRYIKADRNSHIWFLGTLMNSLGVRAVWSVKLGIDSSTH